MSVRNGAEREGRDRGRVDNYENKLEKKVENKIYVPKVEV